VLNQLVRKISITPEVYEDLVTRVEKQLIVQALDEAGGRIRETARRLGMARNTLKAKMQKYGVEPQGGSSDA
jgi:DNA-binding NtrC family response regulator